MEKVVCVTCKTPFFRVPKSKRIYCESCFTVEAKCIECGKSFRRTKVERQWYCYPCARKVRAVDIQLAQSKYAQLHSDRCLESGRKYDAKRRFNRQSDPVKLEAFRVYQAAWARRKRELDRLKKLQSESEAFTSLSLELKKTLADQRVTRRSDCKLYLTCLHEAAKSNRTQVCPVECFRFTPLKVL